MKINSDTAIVRKHHKKNAGAYTKKRKEKKKKISSVTIFVKFPGKATISKTAGQAYFSITFVK